MRHFQPACFVGWWHSTRHYPLLKIWGVWGPITAIRWGRGKVRRGLCNWCDGAAILFCNFINPPLRFCRLCTPRFSLGVNTRQIFIDACVAYFLHVPLFLTTSTNNSFWIIFARSSSTTGFARSVGATRISSILQAFELSPDCIDFQFHFPFRFWLFRGGLFNIEYSLTKKGSCRKEHTRNRSKR